MTWTFTVLYGIDLWGALASQTFEAKVDGWQDLNFLDTQFINCVPELRTYLAPGLLEEMLAEKTNILAGTITAYQEFNDIQFDFEKTVRNVHKAIIAPNPSDVTFIMAR